MLSSRLLARFDRLLAQIEDGLLVFTLTAMILLAGLQIVLRNGWDSGLTWGDPLLRILVLWVGLLGAMAATRANNQITIDLLSRLLSERLNRIKSVVVDLFAAVVCGLLAYHSARFVMMEYEDGMMAFAAVPAWLCELILPLGFGLMALRYLLFCIGHLLGRDGEVT